MDCKELLNKLANDLFTKVDMKGPEHQKVQSIIGQYQQKIKDECPKQCNQDSDEG